jgi:hypothetical protein
MAFGPLNVIVARINLRRRWRSVTPCSLKRQWIGSKANWSRQSKVASGRYFLLAAIELPNPHGRLSRVCVARPPKLRNTSAAPSSSG